MGTVYEAHDTALDRTVAVKVLRPEISEDESTVTRFVREARAAAKVNHPNLTHIYFVGREDGRRFFAMEFLPGRTLEEAVLGDGPMDLAETVEVLVQAARGLGAAHGADVVHRDVKPSNLILADGVVKVTDFGLAKSVSGEMDVTGAGSILGTPRYMSPEQCRGETLDARTDVYSLGLVGFFLLTGEHAYSAPNIGKLLDDQMNAPLPPFPERLAELSPDVRRVFERLCAKRRDDRPVSMEEVIRLLESIRPRELDLAPAAARGGALLLDLLVVAVIFAGLDVLTMLAGGVSLEEHAPRLHSALAFLLVFLSQVGLEAWLGTSLGKRAFHLRVVRADGSPVDARTATARFFLRLPFSLQGIVARRWWDLGVNGLQLAILGVSAFTYFLRGRRTLSDLVTRTRVVHGLGAEKSK
jgi:serine/threonine-protein kinase